MFVTTEVEAVVGLLLARRRRAAIILQDVTVAGIRLIEIVVEVLLSVERFISRRDVGSHPSLLLLVVVVAVR